MSNVMNKVKEQVEKFTDKRESSNQQTGHDHTAGNVSDHRRHEQTSYPQGATTTQGAGGLGSGNTYGSNTGNVGYDNTRSDNLGPHSSNMMNTADPRVDSNTGRTNPSYQAGGIGQTQHGDDYGRSGAGGVGLSDSYGTQTGQTSHIGQTGQLGQAGQLGQHGHQGHHGHHGQHGTEHTGTTGGLSGATGGAGYSSAGTYGAGQGSTYDNQQGTNTGSHNNNLLNKLDPRHNSDRDRVGGYGQGINQGGAPIHDATTHSQGAGYGVGTGSGYGAGTGAGYGSGQGAGYGSGVGTTGTHQHNPMHETGRTGAGGYGDDRQYGGNSGGYNDSSNTAGSGNAPNTAGPHNSNMLNKLDPRVDSDLDGSKTYGGDQTRR